MLVGGNGPTVLDRVLDFGDTWFPNNSDDVLDRAAELHARADRPIDVQVMGVPADPALLEKLEHGGVTRVTRWMPSAHRAAIEPQLDAWERAIAELHGVS